MKELVVGHSETSGAHRSPVTAAAASIAIDALTDYLRPVRCAECGVDVGDILAAFNSYEVIYRQYWRACPWSIKHWPHPLEFMKAAGYPDMSATYAIFGGLCLKCHRKEAVCQPKP